jgi:hypothetical protein
VFVLTEMVSDGSRTASENSNRRSAVGSFVGGPSGSCVGKAMTEQTSGLQAVVLCTGTAMPEQDPVPGPSVWGATAGTAK